MGACPKSEPLWAPEEHPEFGSLLWETQTHSFPAGTRLGTTVGQERKLGEGESWVLWGPFSGLSSYASFVHTQKVLSHIYPKALLQRIKLSLS